MIEKAIDKWNRVRPDNEPVLRKQDLAKMLVEKGFIKSVESALQTFKRWEDGKDTIKMEILRELKNFFGITYETLIDEYFFNDNNDTNT